MFLYISIYMWSCCCHIMIFLFFIVAEVIHWLMSTGWTWLSVPTSPIRPRHAVWHGLGKGWVGQCMWVSKQLVVPSVCTTVHVLEAQRTIILITTDIKISNFMLVCVLFLSEWSAGCAHGPDSHIQPWHDGRTTTCSTPQHGDGVPPESQCAFPSAVPHCTGMVPFCIC